MSRDLQKIINKCLKNDRKAQFDLYHLSFEHLLRICRRYKRNTEDAKSLLNEGFLKILLKLGTYNSKQDFFPWASTIMVRTAIDDYRKCKKYKDQTDLEANADNLDGLSGKQIAIVEQLSAEEIKEIIFSLPVNERMVFNLYEGEGYQHHEIAEKLGVSERTTKRYLRSAKTMLKAMIEKKSDLKKVI